MRASEISIGRTFIVAMEQGDDFFSKLAEFCLERGIVNGYIPGFIAGFSKARIVGTTNEIEDKHAPVWSHVYLEGVEALGCGTLGHTETGEFSPHIHVSVGTKFLGGQAYTSHLLEAEIIFLAEMIVVEVLSPQLIRVKDPTLYNVGLLSFL